MAFETRLTPAMAARWRGAGLWGDETLATVLARRVREAPDREALTEGAHRLTYREFAQGIDRMASRLRALGIGKTVMPFTVAARRARWPSRRG